MKYQEIQEKLMGVVSEVDIKDWLIDEIYRICDDFAYTIPEPQAQHIAHGLYELLDQPEFKYYSVGKIHAIFRNGVAEVYGKAFTTKVTYKLILSWVTAQQRIDRTSFNKNRDDQHEATKIRYPQGDPRFDSPVCQFLSFATQNLICIDVHIWDTSKTKVPPPLVVDLAGRYMEAKKARRLPAFRNELRNEIDKITA